MKKHKIIINPDKNQPSSEGIHLMAKPSGPLCNLRCKYCFYLEKVSFYPHIKDFYMSEEVMEAYIRNNIEMQAIP